MAILNLGWVTPAYAMEWEWANGIVSSILSLDLKFVLTAMVLPLAALLANYVLRVNNGVLTTAGADALLVVVLFDATVLFSSETFKSLVRSQEIQEKIVEVYVGLLVITMISWLVAVVFGEKRIQKGCRVMGDGALELTIKGKFAFCATLIGTFLVVLLHIGTMTWRA